MNFHKSKEEITQAVLKEIPRCQWHSMPVDKVVFQWWLTGRGGQGLRLSNLGSKVFQEAKIAGWDFPIAIQSKSIKKPNATLIRKTIAASPAFITELNKKVTCPYFIGVNKLDTGTNQAFLRVYDHKTAMMITLYGSLQDYLEAKDRTC